MTKSALVSEDLSRAAVVAVGTATAECAAAICGDGSINSMTLPNVDAIDDAVAAVLEQFTNLSHVDTLPAVVVLADTGDWEVVVAFIGKLRAEAAALRVRVWPTFISGDPRALADFDAAIDELGSSATDVVLVACGAPEVTTLAASLQAWLHVKVPAPPSVLADLPDKHGRACRYVALGAVVVRGDDAVAAVTDAAGDELPHTDDVVAGVQASLAGAASSTKQLKLARDAANALAGAAEHFDVTALIPAETALAKSLADIDRSLHAALEARVPALVREFLEGGDELERESAKAELVDSPSLERTELVTSLAQLASKGPMSRMFAKSRMTAIAEQICVAATADVDRVVGKVLTELQPEVTAIVEREVAKVAEERTRAAQRALADQQAGAQQAWQRKVGQARESAHAWTPVSPDAVSRSWGGGLPGPRQYIVTTTESAVTFTEDDSTIAVIDLRSATEGAETNAERSATVLVAQYGLPLSAFVAPAN